MPTDIAPDIATADLDQWCCLGAVGDFAGAETPATLMGRGLTVARGAGAVRLGDALLPSRVSLGHLWASLGAPEGEPPAIPEAAEPDRRHVPCGAVTVRASALRVVENFLDVAHFAFVHTDILGAEPHTEVPTYRCEIRRDAGGIGEVWATEVRVTQPRAAVSAEGAIETRYAYRVMTPTAALLLKTCPAAPGRLDAIALFVQPVAPDLSRAHPMMFLIDEASAQRDLVAFQQVIFLQDRIILENQRPRLLPLEPRAEIPTRADATSVAYRRWLMEGGHAYGTTAGPAA